MGRFTGTLNSGKGGYFGKGHSAFIKYVKIIALQTHNPLNAAIYKDKYWHYSAKVNIFRSEGKVYANDRDWNYYRINRNKIVGFPRYKNK